jgi:hypothetical protein
MWLVTFVPDASGKGGAFSVVENDQIQTEHAKAFFAYSRGESHALCKRAELVLYVGHDRDIAGEVCTKFQDMLRC